MKRFSSRFFNLITACALMLALVPGSVTYASPVPQQTSGKQKNTNKKNTNKKNTNKKGTTSATGKQAGATPKKSATSQGTTVRRKGTATAPKSKISKGAARKAAASKPETSADVKKRQEATHKEIRQTEEQIKENELKVKTELNELGKLQTEISTSKGKIEATTAKINTLSSQISGLEKGIDKNEKDLQKLRDEYLKAVKRMRLARKGHSALSFIFASESFNQALRRMRYLRQFSEWKDRQTAAIDNKTLQLKGQRESLAKVRSEQDEALKRQKSEQNTLQQQYTRQDALVAGLKENGTALKSHLSKKQAEANQLNQRIANLIAEEQRKAEEARKAAEEKARREAEEKARREAEERARREEAARIAEEQRLARIEAEKKAEAEKAVADKAAAAKAKKEKEAEDRLFAENAKKAKAAEKAAEKARAEKAKADKAAAEKAKKEQEKAEKARKEAEAKNRNQDYAGARKRRPRNDKSSVGDDGAGKNIAAVKTVESAKPVVSPNKSVSGGADFVSMKGRLPRPVSGAFNVTSRFGRQSLPDLPDIVYDNPGIDAEVSSGASALAVYPGRVSGVYMIPGYNTVVIVSHGGYYTVYGNISAPSVKIGDQVKAGQALGGLAPDEDNSSRSSIHFEVWRNREKLNPLEWIR